MYDIIVIGAGPAGLSAAYFAASEGLKVAVVGKYKESKAYQLGLVKNYPGFPAGIVGAELMELIVTQAKHAVSDIFEEFADCVEAQSGFVVSTASGKKLSAKAIVLATGAETNFPVPAFGTPGIFLTGELAGSTSIAQAVGSGAQVAQDAVKFVRTVPSLKLI